MPVSRKSRTSSGLVAPGRPTAGTALHAARPENIPRAEGPTWRKGSNLAGIIVPALFVTLPAARPSPGVAVVLWTGGKDSALALHLARQSIRPVRELVTFVPRTGTFLAHPLPLMSAQAAALGLPHRLMTVEEPLAESYDRAIRWLQGQGVSALVTGDIDTVEGYPSWINERASSAGVEVVRPLWKRNRSELLGEMYRVGLRAVITAVRTPPVEIDWLGRLLDPRAIEDL